MQVLLVEDDLLLAQGMIKALQQSGFVVNWLDSGRAACAQLLTSPPDILILDLGLPDIDGMQVLNHVKAHQLSLPVLILSARDDIGAKVAGLDCGADDYLTKPFARDELLARLRVLERRLSHSPSNRLEVGGVSLDLNSHEVLVAGQPLVLPKKEFLLLKALLEQAGIIQTKERLENRLYAWDDEVASNALEVHVHNLRKKLPDNFIRTVRGIGYLVARQ